MQWVETTGKTIDEAKGLALDQLGVGEDDTEFEVLEEPRSGLFGRVKGEARVRARVRPTAVRPKLERRDRKKARDGERTPREPGEAGAAREDEPTRPERVQREPRRQTQGTSARRSSATVTESSAAKQRTPKPQREPIENRQREDSDVSAQQVGEEAKKFLGELVTAFGLVGTVDLREDGDDLELNVAGADLGLMVGPRGNTLLAIQDLTRVASQRRLGDHDTRLRVDIGGYRERRRVALSRFALDVAAQVAASGEARALEAMPSSDRKVIHDVLTDRDDVVTRSEGDDPNRRVVIAPANA
jgi:spoIIIJ-associated protein